MHRRRCQESARPVGIVAARECQPNTESGAACMHTSLLSTTVKLEGSVETVVHESVLGPSVVHPSEVLLLGSVTVNAQDDAAKARRMEVNASMSN